MPAMGGQRDILVDMKSRWDGSGVNQAEKDIGRAAQSMRLFASSFAAHRIGVALREIGQRMREVAKTAFSSAMEWEKGMALIDTQTDVGSAAIDRLGKRALTLAKTLPLPFEDIQEGMYDIFSSMDVSAKGAMLMTKQVSQAAVAGNADVRETTRAAVGALNAFGLQAEDTGHVLDVQFQLVRKGVGTYSDFIGVLGDVYPSAVAAGQSMEDVSAALAFATRNGLNASKAGISVARALDMITRPQYSSAIKNVLGVDVIDPATGGFRRIHEILGDISNVLGGLSEPERKEVLADVFGSGEIRAARFFNVAVKNFDDLNNMVTHFSEEKVGGAMMDAFDTMTDTATNQLGTLRSLFMGIGTELADNFVPQLRAATEWLKNIGEWIDKLPAGVKSFAGAIFLLVTGFVSIGAPIMLFMANLMGTQALMLYAETTARQLFATMMASARPLLLMAMRFALIVTAISLLVANWDKVKKALVEQDSLWGALIYVVGYFAARVIVGQLIPAIMSAYKAIVGRLVAAMAAASLSMTAAGGATAFFKTALMGINPVVVALTAAIAAAIAVYTAWKFAQEEHAKSVDASRNLAQAWTDQIKLGVRTAEENLPKIKAILDDESLSWEERNSIVHDSLRQYNEWVRAGGEVVDANNSTARSVQRQIMVNEELGQSTEWLRKKVTVFAGMNLEAFNQWRKGTVNAINGVRGAFDNLVTKTKLTQDKIINQFQRGLEKTKEWGKDFRFLLSQGIPDSMAKLIQEQGVTSAEFVKELANMARNNKGKFNEIKNDWREGQREANRISKLVGQDIGGIGTAANTVKGKVDTLAASLRNIPSEVVINFRLNGLPSQVPTTNLDVSNQTTGSRSGRSGVAANATGVTTQSRQMAPVVVNNTFQTVAGLPDMTERAMEEVRWHSMMRGY